MKKLNNLNRFQTNLLHLSLFIITMVGTTFAGAEWMFGKSFAITGITTDEFLAGLSFSIPFLGILTVHEFGHYFTAKYYKLKVSLPYFIPMWFFGLGPSIGTMGAFISIKSRLRTRKEFFDVGISGPMAGFLVALGVLYYGFTHLPPAAYIFNVHPEYEQWGLDYAKYAYENIPEGQNFMMGTNLLFEFFKAFVVTDPSLIPNPHEMIHYPFLLAGYLACFFTALNLIPIGQLDGGHILYSMLGYKTHKKIVPVLFLIFLFYAGLGMFSMHDEVGDLLIYAPVYIFFLYWVLIRTYQNRMQTLVMAVGVFTAQFVVKSFFPEVEGYQGWLLFALLIGRVIGVYHPPAIYAEPIGWKRQVLGVMALVVFILCFSPMPFIVK
ncbi:site-2 protease family protein [Limibacter armeniacum]|uniref:site-2 protease family protein n=1 Tax=Limibacter armeniacum TaxID=466084 RepID=UPI002FE57660